MCEAVLGPITGLPVVQSTTPSPVIALFSQWCSCVRFVAPPHLDDDAREAAYDRVCDRAEEILAQLGTIAMGDDLAMGAVLWIVTWNHHRMVDPQNGTLPHCEKAAGERQMVDNIAAHYPDLARVAGVKFA
jgi:hypothetical protein